MGVTDGSRARARLWRSRTAALNSGNSMAGLRSESGRPGVRGGQSGPARVVRAATTRTLPLWLARTGLAVAEGTPPGGVIAVGFDDTPQRGHIVQQTIYPPVLEESAAPVAVGAPGDQPPAPPKEPVPLPTPT